MWQGQAACTPLTPKPAPFSLPAQSSAAALATLAQPQSNLFFELRFHRQSRVDGMNVFVAFPLRAASIPRRKAAARQGFEQFGALVLAQISHAQINCCAIRLAVENPIAQVIAVRARVVAHGLTDAPGLNLRGVARLNIRAKRHLRHAIRPPEMAVRERHRLKHHAHSPGFPKPYSG